MIFSEYGHYHNILAFIIVVSVRLGAMSAMGSSLRGARLSSAAVRIAGLALAFALGVFGEGWAGGGQGRILEVLHDGCKAIGESGDGPVCMLSSDCKLILWVGVDDCNKVRVEEDGRVLSATSLAVRGGCQLQFLADSQQPTGFISIADARTGQSLWSVKVDRTKPDLLAWTERVTKRADADLDAVAAELGQRASKQSDVDRLMDITLATGESYARKGLRDSAIHSFCQSIEYAQRARLPSVSSEAAYNAAFLLREGGLVTDSKALLRQANELSPRGSGIARMRVNWLEGVILDEQENLSDAMDMYREVLLDAEKLSKRDWERKVAPVLAEGLMLMDRRQEAEEMLAKFDQLLEGAANCKKTNMLASKGWILLHWAEDKDQPGIQTRVDQQVVNDVFLQALTSYGQCLVSGSLANILTALATVAFLENRFADAQDWLVQARQVPGAIVRNKLQLMDLEARLALKSGRIDEAKRLVEDLDLTLQNSQEGEREFKCKAAIGKLEILSILGQTDATLSEKVSRCIEPQTNNLPPFTSRSLNRRARSLVKGTLPMASQKG